MSSHVLETRQLNCGYSAEHPVVASVDLRIETGTVTCLLGPNGAGKTTLFKTLLGFLKPLHGSILVDGENTAGWSRKRLGQVFGYIPQQHTPSFAFTVREVVLMGRTPHLSGMGRVGASDERAAMEALEKLGMAGFADRDYTELSGGERQMVLVARVLAQRPQFLVMDEPTSALDLGNQARVLECISALAAEGYGILMTTHDPNQAFLLGGQVVCMGRDGELVTGMADATLTEALLGKLYGCEVFVQTHEGAAGTTSTCVPALDLRAASRGGAFAGTEPRGQAHGMAERAQAADAGAEGESLSFSMA